MASMALSKRTLSGCFESTLAIGFFIFLLEQPMASSMAAATPRIANFFKSITSTYLGRATLLFANRYCRFLPLYLLQTSFHCCLEELFCLLFGITFAKHRVASNQYFSAGAHNISYRLQRHASVHLDTILQAAALAYARKLRNLMQRPGNELLRSEAWVYGHDEHVIHYVQNLGQGIDRSRRINDHSDLTSMIAYMLQRAIQMPCGFLVDRNPVRTSIGKGRNELVRVFDHQVAIERQIRVLADRSHHWRANREIRDKMAVHHIQVHGRGSALGCRLNLVRKTGEVGRQNRRSKLDQGISQSASAGLPDAEWQMDQCQVPQ